MIKFIKIFGEEKMSNRFKFRVWDKECNYFHDMPDYFVSQTGELCSMQPNHRNDWDMLPVENPENYVIQQCTGLKDCENNLIWEGDITECRVLCGNKDGFYEPEDPSCIYKTTGEIKYKGTHFYIEAKYKDCIIDIHFHENMNIIGNVFEGIENEKD